MSELKIGDKVLVPSRLSPIPPPPVHSDATRFVTGETHAWKGVEITSGAGQVELLVVHGDKSLGVVLTPAQAYDLGDELMNRSRKLRAAK